MNLFISSILKKSILIGCVVFMVFPVYGKDGKTLFKGNCAACHSIGKGRMVGPDLKGVHKKRSEEWLMKWIKSSQSLIKSGDADAIAIFKEYNSIPMTPFDFLPEEDIKSILAYIQTESEPQAAASSVPAKTEPSHDISKTGSGLSFGSYILIALIVLLLIVIWQLSRTIKILSDKLR